jgi:hypothetical protein
MEHAKLFSRHRWVIKDVPGDSGDPFALPVGSCQCLRIGDSWSQDGSAHHERGSHGHYSFDWVVVTQHSLASGYTPVIKSWLSAIPNQ